MSKNGRDLTSDEKKLWRRVAEGVKTCRRLPDDTGGAEYGPERNQASEKPRSTHASAPPTEAPAKTPPPQQRGNEKRVRRGKLEIGSSLDLHGHTQDSGRAALLQFLRAAQLRGDRTVIVITGVGRSGEGVLKRRFPEWLAASEVRPFVTGYAPAHRTHGGAGAFYVFLKRAN